MRVTPKTLGRKRNTILQCGMTKARTACLIGVSLSSVRCYAKMAQEGIGEGAGQLLEELMRENPLFATIYTDISASLGSVENKEVTWIRSSSF